MSVPTIALIPPKPKLAIRQRRLTVEVCQACQQPIRDGDACRCND